MRRQPRAALVPVERTWDAESVFASVEAWEAELEPSSRTSPVSRRIAGRLARGRMTARTRSRRATTSSGGEPRRRLRIRDRRVRSGHDEPGCRRSLGRAQSLPARSRRRPRSSSPNCSRSDSDRVLEWSRRNAGFAPYAHYFDDLFRRGEHVRSSEVEELLGHAGRRASRRLRRRTAASSTATSSSRPRRERPARRRR